jgi:hypothetical protein
MGQASMQTTEDAWTAQAVGLYQTAFTNMHDGAFNAVPGMHQCVVRYNYLYTDVPTKKKYLATRESLNSTPPVVGYLVKSNIGTQRRRARIGG